MLKKVGNANNKFNSINIPSSFKYADLLKKVKNKVSSLNDDVSDLEKWMDVLRNFKFDENGVVIEAEELGIEEDN